MLPSVHRLLAALFSAGRPATRLWLVAAATVTLAVPAAPAHAQLLKRIKQAAAEKAADAAGRKVLGEEKADSAAAPAGSAAPAADARSTSRTAAARGNAPTKLDVTPERVDQFLVAMEPYREVARQREAHAAAEQKVADYEKCFAAAGQQQAAMAVKGTAPQPTRAQQAEIDRILEGNDALSQAMLAAMAAGDTVKQRVLADSSVRINHHAMMLMNPLVAKNCGATKPAKPAPLDDGALRKAALPRRIDGWTPAQFGLMRERIAMHLLMPEKSGLAPEERTAVDAKRAGFQPYLAMWKETGDWKSWGEFWSAWKTN